MLPRSCFLANDGEALFALTLAAGIESDPESILQKKHLVG